MRPLTSFALCLLLASTAVAVHPDALRVVSSHEPTPAVEVQPARELWRVTDGDTDELMGVIADIVMDADGNTLMLDRSFKTVRIYGPDGEYINSVGREGDGPGEFRNPEKCLALPDGRVGVAELFPARIVTLTRDDVPADPIELPGEGSMQILTDVVCRADRVHACSSMLKMNEEGVTSIAILQSVNTLGERQAVFKQENTAADTQGGAVTVSAAGEDFAGHWAVDAAGRVYVAPLDHEYMVEVYNADGDLERVLDVEYDSVKRSQKEIQDIEDQRGQFQTHGVQVDLPPVDPYLRDIQTLYPRNDGSLWIRSSRGMRDRPDGTVGAFDVFDASGKLVRRVALSADFDPDYDEWMIVGDRLFILKESLSAPETSGMSGGGGAMVVQLGRPSRPEPDENREAQPFAVICYEI